MNRCAHRADERATQDEHLMNEWTRRSESHLVTVVHLGDPTGPGMPRIPDFLETERCAALYCRVVQIPLATRGLDRRVSYERPAQRARVGPSAQSYDPTTG